MGRIRLHAVDIPLNSLNGTEELFFRQIQMKGEKVKKKFLKQYESTRINIYENVTAKGIFASVGIEAIRKDDICLEDGSIIRSPMLSKLFQDSVELIMCAVTLQGYDELEKASDKGLAALFLDSWGTAIAELGHGWVKERIREQQEKDGFYLTHSWCPGQHNIDIKLQKDLFRLLKPETIGMELTKSCMMHPKKSISSFIGLGTDPDAKLTRACDFCEHRDTCPSAYV